MLLPWPTLALPIAQLAAQQVDWTGNTSQWLNGTLSTLMAIVLLSVVGFQAQSGGRPLFQVDIQHPCRVSDTAAQIHLSLSLSPDQPNMLDEECGFSLCSSPRAIFAP
ncbi:hypothetical protein BDW62DRAFT_174514 [Aspergillus aurantiobrunneus]